MVSQSYSTLLQRDDNDVVYVDGYGNVYSSDSFWYTQTGMIVKWVLFFAFVTFVTMYFFIGRALARRRVRNGKIPFFGTAWILSRRERGLVDPRFATATAWPGQVAYHPQQGGYHAPPAGQQYSMGGMYTAPPPVYDGHRPPVYDAGANGAGVGGTKIDPSQGGQTSGVEPTAPVVSDFAPPSGPPPAR